MGWKTVVALSGALVLGGCISSGTDVSDQAIQQFQRGRTTEAEVVSRLGPPTSRRTSADGEIIDSYTFTKISYSASNFIPYIGPLIGGSSERIRDVHFMFDRRGILKDWTAGDNTTANSGVLGTH